MPGHAATMVIALRLDFSRTLIENHAVAGRMKDLLLLNINVIVKKNIPDSPVPVMRVDIVNARTSAEVVPAHW